MLHGNDISRFGSVRGALFAAALILFSTAGVSRAQIISPGKLTAAHADLEGITNCTNCHALGEKGISNVKCLDCHEVIKELVDLGKGYHAANAKQNCASCHKEHFGREFDTIHLDTLSFRHNDTGYPLIASHQSVACSSCHSAKFITAPSVLKEKKTMEERENTFLGLPQTCATCHADDNPHGNQFADLDCSSCHLERKFEEVPLFDHNESSFPLTGRHTDVECSNCHKPAADDIVQYLGLDFTSCNSCHEDVHKGDMGGNCTSCHNTGGWNSINSASFERTFNHSKTGYELVGKHSALACASCHSKPARNTTYVRLRFVAGTQNKAYPHPRSENCTSCHKDYHDGAFVDSPEGAECNTCHTEDGWQPSNFDIDQHNELSRFELTGAHLATPCFACHENPERGHVGPEFRFDRIDCESCHASDSKHGSQFADTLGITTCDNCHTTEVWTEVSFDHAATEFPLLGAHAAVACESCHTSTSILRDFGLAPQDTSHVRFIGLDMTCASCHKADSPHQDQFTGIACNTCHDEESFLIAAFDHEATNFPLTGGHENVACVQCHKTETAADGTEFVRFKPLGTQCEDCHDSER
ncbi:MAG: cytochrome c3 family protein [Bacteroidetes bacterium]|nr:cytochrome c3 family protein [Bacteroidota bacterium]